MYVACSKQKVKAQLSCSFYCISKESFHFSKLSGIDLCELCSVVSSCTYVLCMYVYSSDSIPTWRESAPCGGKYSVSLWETVDVSHRSLGHLHSHGSYHWDRHGTPAHSDHYCSHADPVWVCMWVCMLLTGWADHNMTKSFYWYNGRYLKVGSPQISNLASRYHVDNLVCLFTSELAKNCVPVL